jgi:hypothetical protein
MLVLVYIFLFFQVLSDPFARQLNCSNARTSLPNLTTLSSAQSNTNYVTRSATHLLMAINPPAHSWKLRLGKAHFYFYLYSHLFVSLRASRSNVRTWRAAGGAMVLP